MFRAPVVMHHRRGRREGVDPILFLLFFQLWQHVQQLPVKPPVTLALAAGGDAPGSVTTQRHTSFQ